MRFENTELKALVHAEEMSRVSRRSLSADRNHQSPFCQRTRESKQSLVRSYTSECVECPANGAGAGRTRPDVTLD